MTAPAAVERPWSAKHWVLTVLFLLAGQAGLAWWLSDRSTLQVREERRPLQVRLASLASSPELAALLQVNNPARFVLPGREGFSGPAWLAVRPLAHRSPGWSNPPQWLQPRPEGLLAEFSVFAATNHPSRVALSERSSRPAEPRIAWDSSRLPPVGTRMQISGDLTIRDLVGRPDLPAIEHTGLLRPTTVAVRVDQRGRVYQVTLAPGGSSGLAAADERGLDLVRALRFVVDPTISPSRNGRDFEKLREGRITLHWWIQPPAEGTNSPATTPVLQSVL